LLKAISISDISLTSSPSSVPKQSKNAILNIGRVVELQVFIAYIQDILMCMLSRDFTTAKHALGQGGPIGHWHGVGDAEEGNNECGGFVLHVDELEMRVGD